jgi:hypothetical protein
MSQRRSTSADVSDLARDYTLPVYLRQVDRYGRPLSPWEPFADGAAGEMHFRPPIGDREEDLPDWRNRE